MAKAKKSETAAEGAGAPKKKPAAPRTRKKAAAKSAAPQAAAPLIDTSLAAQAAAKMLAAGLNKPAQTQQPQQAKQESAMFKQLKAGLNKPASSTMSNLLEKSHGPELTKSHQAFNKQVGHNQTFGADVTRSGVPRRTPG